MKCPNCGNELDEDKYCDECFEFFNDLDDDSQDFGFEEGPDFDSMVKAADERMYVNKRNYKKTQEPVKR